MLLQTTGRAPVKGNGSKNNTATAKHTPTRTGMPRGATNKAAASAADTATATPARSARAEALVQHVSQLPTFSAWAAPSTAAAAAATVSPRAVAQYLEERVAEVSAQLDSLQHAGDYNRLVVLLTELLQSDMAVGVTPRMIEGGLLQLLRATAAAVANGKRATLPAPVGVSLASPGQTLSTTLAGTTKRPASAHSGTIMLSSQYSTGAMAVPIESLLPPLIDQSVRKPKLAPDGLGGTAVLELTEDEAEMEAWENYMATVRVATTTADAANARHLGAASALCVAADATGTGAAAAPPHATAGAGGAVPVDVAEHTCRIQSLPDALCALIASCTAAPFISLTLQDQQSEKAAVVSTAGALIATAAEMPLGNAELSVVRLAAIEGLYLLLSTYIAGGRGGRGGAASGKDAQTGIWRGVQPSKVLSEVPLTMAPPAVLLDSAELAAMLRDVTLDWAHILVRLRTGSGPGPAEGQAQPEPQDSSSGEDENEEAGAVAAAAAASANSGAVGELNWTLEIALLLLHAQQHVCQRAGNRTQPLPHDLLPRGLLPVVLRTLAMLPVTPAVSSRAVTFSRRCVDVLWTATLLAPVAASRQLLYGALPESNERDGDGEVASPAVDFFLALLHQFNETHSLAHREMRDDLVTLLALLLRCDRQFVENVLTARRAATDGTLATAGSGGGSVVRSEASSPLTVDPTLLFMMPGCAIDGGCSPLSLSVATVEAINAIVALIFETTCGTELGAAGAAASVAAAPREEVRPSAMLSEEAVRSYALRFQSVTISAARRREVVEFKKYGWQLLAVHCDWQLAHLTFREYVNLHDPVAGTAPSPRLHRHERSSPIPQVTGESAADEAVTAALWGMQLSHLGYFDVLLLYVDMDSSVPAVVTWTREELMLLEHEAWQLFTSMILSTQHLDAVAGGIRVRRRRRYASSASVSRAGGSRSHGLSGASISAGEDETMDDEDNGGGGVLYGADMHFIAAGGVDVALRFLTTAPAEMEAVKRSALVTLAAIARTSSSAEAHLHSGSYTTKDVALVHRALTEYAPSLVPFLVRVIREVDTHVDATGMPAAAPPLITTAAATVLRNSNNNDMEGTRVSTTFGEASMEAAHTAARWGWLPYSANVTVIFAWCLLRSIGDVVLMEVGMVRELPDLAADRDKNGSEDDENADDDDAAELDKSSSIRSCAHTARHSALDGRYSTGSLPPPEQGLESTRILMHDADEPGDGGHEGQLYAADMNVSVAADDRDDLSSSGYSMGPPPGEEGAAAVVAAAPPRNATGRKSAASPRGRAATGSPRPIFVATSINASNQNIPDAADASASGDGQARRRTLLRSVHEDVLLIPEVFAAEGGIDALVVWIRHTLRLCLSARAQAAQWVAQTSPHQRPSLPQLTKEEVVELDYFSDLFLLHLDVFRAIVLGSEGNEEMFVRSGGVHGLLDLIEAFALAHGLISRAAAHARHLAADLGAVTTTFDQSLTTSRGSSGGPVAGVKEGKGVLCYAMTLLSDLLDNCPCALDEFATWRSRHILTSPLTPDVQECWAGSKGVEAVQLLLCLWAADLPARSEPLMGTTTASATGTGLELLRLHLSPALRVSLKEEYVCRLLRRRARMGVLEAETIRGYYRYIHAESIAASAAEEVTDAVVLAYMERIMSRHRKRNAVSAEQQIALLVNDTLGLCLKVYGCLAAVGFDSLHAAETETAASPSLNVNLSSLERSILVQIAALPALCVDEISTAMAEVALGSVEDEAKSATAAHADFAQRTQADGGVAAWRPTTPDRKTLSNAAAEAAIRASELDQIIEVGAQVQQARQEQLYHRYLVTQLRQPVAPPADGRPGAVKGAWKTQRRLSTTLGGSPVTASTTATAAGVRGAQAGEHAVELAARLSSRLTAEEQQRQHSIAATVLAKSTGRRTWAVDARAGSERLLMTAPSALGSSRTPYPSLMGSVHAAAATERPAATTFVVTPPPHRPAVPLTERHQKRRAMIARSVRKAPLDGASVKESRKP